MWPKLSSELKEKVTPCGSGKYFWVCSTHRTEISHLAVTEHEHRHNQVFIAWAGTGEPCFTGAEVRGSTAEMW